VRLAASATKILLVLASHHHFRTPPRFRQFGDQEIGQGENFGGARAPSA
jgi:hypothetical protein